MSKFKKGDLVLCIKDSVQNPNVKRGEIFTIQATYPCHVALETAYGIHNENLFVIDDQPDVDQPEFSMQPPDKCLEYLMDAIEEYADDPPAYDDAYDHGYRDCMLDILKEVYGVVPVTHVEFATV